MTGLAARSITLLALVSLLFAITAASGSAAGPGRGHILGVVPHSAPRAAAIRPAVPATLTFDASTRPSSTATSRTSSTGAAVTQMG